jgi:hypothetical protein
LSKPLRPASEIQLRTHLVKLEDQLLPQTSLLRAAIIQYIQELTTDDWYWNRVLNLLECAHEVEYSNQVLLALQTAHAFGLDRA